MSVNIFTGAPGAGKTEDIYKELIDSSLKNPEKKHIVITPEQNTLLTEKRLLGMNPKHILFNIDVLSFNRVSSLIFNKAGIGNPVIIDETGKSMLLRRVIARNNDAIKYYSNSVNTPGFISKLKVMISELLMYGITPDDIDSYIVKDEIKANDSLKAKLVDLKNILSLFLSSKDSYHLTSEEMLPKALSYIDKTNIFDGSMVVFDGYNGFTPIQYEFIKAISARCDELVFSFDIPSSENVLGNIENYELFYPVKQTIKKLQTHINSIGTNANIVPHEDLSRVIRDNALTHLSMNFLRDNPAVYELPSYPKSYEAPISIWSCLNPVKEAEFIAHEIIRLVKDEGLKFRDIAVVTGQLPETASVIKETFLKEGIPAYIDTKDSITHNPLCIFLLSLLEIVEKSFKNDVVVRFAKTSIANISKDELDILENYVIAHGINGSKKWSEDFTRNSYRFHENIDLDSLNKIRNNLIEPVIEFKEDFKKAKTFSEATAAILKVFDTCNVEEKIKALSDVALEDNEIVEASIHDQIYSIVIQIINELDKLLGDEKRPSAKELREILKSGIEEYKVGSLPPSIDEVHIGDINRSRRGYVKAMFFASFNDGVVPSPVAGGGILNDSDREELINADINIAPSSKQTSFDQQYTIYQILSAPTHRLYISYNRLSLSNENLNPSSYLNVIKELYSNLNTNNFAGIDYDEISNSHEALNYLASNLNKDNFDDTLRNLTMIAKSLNTEEDIKNLSLIYSGAFFNYQGEKLKESTTNIVFSEDLTGSVSRLESQASCSYKTFLDYILDLKERASLEFSPFDMGNFYHSVLENTFSLIIDQDKPYESISDDDFDSIISIAIDNSKDEIKSYDILETGKGKYFLERWKKIIKTTTRSMINNLKESTFKPTYVEKEFDSDSSPSLMIALDNGNSMKMHGKIDRVDVEESEDKINFKIVDYKSSFHKLDKHLVDGGIQLQLLTYLNAMDEVLRNEFPNKDIQKSGVSYFEIKQQYAEAKSINDDVAEKVDSMYKYASKEDELDELAELVKERNKDIANSIIAGEISKNPYLYDKKSPCDYCSYKDMCEFDPRLNGYIRRYIAYKDPEDNKGDNQDEV